MIKKNNKILLLGFGYTAQHFAQLLLENNYDVTATSRNQEVRDYWQQRQVQMIDFNFDAISEAVADTGYILSSIPPNEAVRDPCLEVLSSLLLNLGDECKWLAYLSSTGVYGDHQGAWVDEESSCLHPGPRAQRRIEVENAWLSLYHQCRLPLHIFRLAGIYGPQRNVFAKIKSGEKCSIIKEGQFFSRIHVTDIVRALWCSMSSPTPGEIFNLCDDAPCASHELDAYAADLLGVGVPDHVPIDEANLSPMAMEFYRSNRRVSNAKIKRVLNFTLQYPSYKEGLKQLLCHPSSFER